MALAHCTSSHVALYACQVVIFSRQNRKKINTVKPVLSGHSKIDKTKVLMANGSLMKVESIAECCNTFDLH